MASTISVYTYHDGEPDRLVAVSEAIYSTFDELLTYAMDDLHIGSIEEANMCPFQYFRALNTVEYFLRSGRKIVYVLNK